MSLFEQVRDAYFVDPRNPEANQDLADATSYMVYSLDNPSQTSGEAATPVEAVARELAADYQGARRFDHLSVAQLHPADNKLGALAHLASTLYNNNTIIGEVSPVETDYEYTAVRWMVENVAGFNPDTASGSLVSGGTSANHTALTVARERLQAEGWDGRTPAKVFASQMAHYSVTKSARLLAPGGLISVDKVPLEPGGYRLDPAVLRERVAQARRDGTPIMGIVAVAGETETGLVDDLDAIAEIADEHGVYLHIDGAYGAPYRLSRESAAFDATSRANSLTCDPHKYLYVPYSSGAIMFNSAEEHALLEGLNDDGEGYMFKSDAGKLVATNDFIHNTTYLGRKRLEGSMGGQAAAALHTTIKYVGREGLAALLDHNLEMTDVFASEMLTADGLELAFEPQLNTVCVEPTGRGDLRDAKVELVSAALQRNHGIYLSTTSLPNRDGSEGSRKVFRFVATHPHTSEDDVLHIASALKESWKEVDQ